MGLKPVRPLAFFSFLFSYFTFFLFFSVVLPQIGSSLRCNKVDFPYKTKCLAGQLVEKKLKTSKKFQVILALGVEAVTKCSYSNSLCSSPVDY